MKMHIKEFANLTGVSVRTLHYYDKIGLLKPFAVDEQNGYRFYDEKNLSLMQEIMFYRELDFPLKDIMEILSSPSYDKQIALNQQKHLLILKKERLERLISAIDSAMKGENFTMNVFDNSEFNAQREQYAKEAKEKWGNTSAYEEYVQKTNDYSNEKWNEINNEMNSIMTKFAKYKENGFAPDSEKAQTLVKLLQDYITQNYYICTKEILAGLGQMYVNDERFKTNIDKNGSGTAEFMCMAIRVYCRK